MRIEMDTQMDTRAFSPSYLNHPTLAQVIESMVPGVGIEPTCRLRGRGF